MKIPTAFEGIVLLLKMMKIGAPIYKWVVGVGGHTLELKFVNLARFPNLNCQQANKHTDIHEQHDPAYANWINGDKNNANGDQRKTSINKFLIKK